MAAGPSDKRVAAMNKASAAALKNQNNNAAGASSLSFHMKADQLLQLLMNKAMSFAPKGESLSKKLINASSSGSIDLWQPSRYHPPIQLSSSSANFFDAKLSKPLTRNYYGLPSMANSSLMTADSLVMDCRLPMLSAIQRHELGSNSLSLDHTHHHHGNSSQYPHGNRNNGGDVEGEDMMLGEGLGASSSFVAAHHVHGEGEEKLSGQVDAQRKVARSLLTMAQNAAMTHLYVTKGGVDAVFRLLNDTHDLTVGSTLSLLLSLLDGCSR
jgi:hypothetical protein